MPTWYPIVQYGLFFLIGAFAMLCFTLMRYEAPKTTVFAGIGGFVVTILTMRYLGLAPGCSIFVGMVSGYVLAHFGVGFFRGTGIPLGPESESESESEPEPTTVRKPIAVFSTPFEKRDGEPQPNADLHATANDDLPFMRFRRSSQQVDIRV